MTAPVLIVGGGPVGLSAALELARFSVPSILLEQREGITEHPKTRIINSRTVEIARGWGQADYARLHAIDTPQEWKSPVRFLRSVVGEELGHIDSERFAGPGPDVTPAPAILSSQELLERVLYDAAGQPACDATVRPSCRFAAAGRIPQRPRRGGRRHPGGERRALRALRVSACRR